MNCKELIGTMRGDSIGLIVDRAHDTADAIETLLAERDAAVEDLTRICEDNPDVCQYCKHMPCSETHGRCIGWEWRGPRPSKGNYE